MRLTNPGITVRLLLSFFLCSICHGLPSLCADDFELRDGDRVVFLGSEFIEQQIKHNFLEAQLTQLWPERKIQFRNLGWSGDTPSGIARGYFGGADEGFRRLMDELDRLKPTVVFVCYGANADSSKFSNEFNRLLAELKKRTHRIVVMSHPAAEMSSPVSTQPNNANRVRQASAEALQSIAKRDNTNRVRLIDLYSITAKLLSTSETNPKTRLPSGHGLLPVTHDTIRYAETGYRHVSNAIIESLGLKQRQEPSEELRLLIAEKNRLYFHRYRPQNETYLRGFRKHEQGQNAKEIAEFDELIEHAESRIFAFVNGNPVPEPASEPDPIKLTFEALAPEQQRALFTLPDELEVNLFASEPMIANPIHMNFDSQGRLWVATSPIYPHIKPGAKSRDEIIVLEDTDGDGRADKRTVFADDLLIPTAVLPDERGGAYVANSTELIHLADIDGDGKADTRRVVLAGFGTEDTHHIIHTFRWGPDTSLYFNQSIYIHTHMETPHGVRRLMGSGIWRFEPESLRANVLMRGLVNPWGHIFDDWGQSFATDGAGGNGINYAFPGSAYQSAVGFRNVLRGMNPGQPKLCSLEIVSGGHFPEAWQGTLVTNDFRGNRINRFQLTEQGSGYISKQLPDLLSSSHRAFRPVDVKMAPDGTLMVADWYNPIINHGEVDFRDSRRDYKHGRIWRVTAKDQPLVANPDFRTATVIELVEILKAPEQWNRVKARIELKRRDQDEVTLAIEKQLLTSTNVRDRLEALWTFEAIGATSIDAIKQSLASDDHRVRAAAVRILANQPELTPIIHRLIVNAASDVHPRVRLEFIHAWRRACPPNTVEALLTVLEQPLDPNLEFALVNAIRDTSNHWFERYVNSDIEGGREFDKRLFVFRQVESPQTVPELLGLLQIDASPPHNLEIIELIGQRGNVEQLKTLLDLTLIKSFFEKNYQTEYARQVVRSLLDASIQRKVTPPIDPEDLVSFMDQPEALHLAGIFSSAALARKKKQSETLRDRLTTIATHPSPTHVQLQIGAIRGLAAMGEVAPLEAIARSNMPMTVRRESIKQLVLTQPALAAKLAVEILNVVHSDSEASEAGLIADIFLTRKGGASRLAKALAGKSLPENVTRELIKRANAKGAQGKILASAIRSSEPTLMKKVLTKAEFAQLVKLVQTKGDPVRGESVYRRDKLNCIKCHAIGGAGGVVGPDMISLGASSPVDYIVESLVDPNAKIKEGYHTTTVITSDGQQISGKMMSQADGKLTLRDAENKEHVFDDADIEAQKISSVSLMPTDLTANLSQADFVDLAAFLASLGKEGQFKVSSELFVRQWIIPDGTVVYSRVDGTLPINEIKGNVVSCEIEVTVPGAIGIHVENPNGLRITLNDMKDNLQGENLVSDLEVGIHRFTFQLTKKNRESLRVKLFDVEGSKGHAVLRNQ